MAARRQFTVRWLFLMTIAAAAFFAIARFLPWHAFVSGAISVLCIAMFILPLVIKELIVNWLDPTRRSHQQRPSKSK